MSRYLMPPYPSPEVTASSLYSSVLDFHTFIGDLGDGLDSKPDVSLRPPLVLQAHLELPLGNLCGIVCSLRWFREEWDSVVRNFHGKWDSPRAVSARFRMLMTAISIANVMYASRELLEHMACERMASSQLVDVTALHEIFDVGEEFYSDKERAEDDAVDDDDDDDDDGANLWG